MERKSAIVRGSSNEARQDEGTWMVPTSSALSSMLVPTKSKLRHLRSSSTAASVRRGDSTVDACSLSWRSDVKPTVKMVSSEASRKETAVLRCAIRL